MNIGGLQKFSLLDYPEHIAAIIFTLGCNFRCQFCYNPLLILPQDKAKEGHPLINEDDLFAFLKSRIGKLDAVVITGGEPTLQSDLVKFITKVKKLGFKVKLDTNGTDPDLLEELIKQKLIDYIAMDIKGAPSKYDLVTGVQPDLKKIKKSIKIIISSKLPYEFRTTIVPELIIVDDIQDIGSLIQGAEKWFLQQFKSDIQLVNSSFEGVQAYSSKELEKMREIGKKYVKICEIR